MDDDYRGGAAPPRDTGAFGKKSMGEANLDALFSGSDDDDEFKPVKKERAPEPVVDRGDTFNAKPPKKKAMAFDSSESEEDMGAGKVNAKLFQTAGAPAKSALKKSNYAPPKKEAGNLFGGGDDDDDSDDVDKKVVARTSRQKTITKKKVVWGDEDSDEEKPIAQTSRTMARRPTAGLAISGKRKLVDSDDDEEDDDFDFNFGKKPDQMAQTAKAF